MNLNIPDDHLQFIVNVLQSQPLPFNQVAPVMNNLVSEINRHQAEAQAAANAPAKSLAPVEELPHQQV